MMTHPQISAKPLKELSYLEEYSVCFPMEIEDGTVVTLGTGHKIEARGLKSARRC